MSELAEMKEHMVWKSEGDLQRFKANEVSVRDNVLPECDAMASPNLRVRYNAEGR